MAVSHDVEDFIRTTFRSVWALELLCLLRRIATAACPLPRWSQGLRGSDLVVTQSVDALTVAGLVIIDAEGGARFCPASDDLEQLFEQTAILYGKSFRTPFAE